ncbi:MAG: endonuclease VIII [Oscillospiraceae bacterium]|jgi:formamidopyrimidine-DNA glycosylase|nr:endonuclease VIII [Oscillospiraceae bacterium]
MIELPEAYTLAKQIGETLVGKTIINAVADSQHHVFAWYTDDPKLYGQKLNGKKITDANPGTGYSCGGNTEILCEDMLLVISTPIRYHAPSTKLPKSHQLLLEFEDGSHMSCTVQMWGAMLLFPINGEVILPDGFTKKCPSPYDDAFDESYFDSLRQSVKPTLSVKAFLATEQRIPGFGNGVLHDVLFNARIHPKRKLNTLSDAEFAALYHSVKDTLKAMRDGGGRDTEKDLFGNAGGYHTILSSKTLAYQCPVCGDGLKREAYLGGNIYFCPTCQPLVK